MVFYYNLGFFLFFLFFFSHYRLGSFGVQRSGVVGSGGWIDSQISQGTLQLVGAFKIFLDPVAVAELGAGERQRSMNPHAARLARGVCWCWMDCCLSANKNIVIIIQYGFSFWFMDKVFFGFMLFFFFHNLNWTDGQGIVIVTCLFLQHSLMYTSFSFECILAVSILQYIPLRPKKANLGL